ncbi:polysaccharide deacetylase family protein [Fodinibacter luteus]|uniref:Polysaccharide deacetylase family protein n=1 Tax=Fodinibacter luteus TaxID=552064 RepID=A0ABP8KS87_9MICO
MPWPGQHGQGARPRVGTLAGAGTLSGVGAMAGVGAVAAHVALNQPPWAARLLEGQDLAVFSVRTQARAVAITIDDGPHEPLTGRLLDVLARHRALATFFVLGSQAAVNPASVAAAHGAGHEIGNHGWLDRPAVLLSRAEFRDDATRTAAAVASATGTPPRLVRPGSGWFRPGHLHDLRRMGWTLALGSIAPHDLEVADVDRELAFVVDRIRPGAVVVLHEGRPERARVVDLLDRLLDELDRRGYAAVTLSRLVEDRT